MFIIKKEILISGKGPMKELDNTALTAEAECFLNFTKLVKQNLIYLIYLASLNFTLSNDSIFYNFLQPRNVIVVYSYVLYFYSTLLVFIILLF